MSATVEEQFEIVQAGVRKSAPLVADFFDTTTPLYEHSLELSRYVAHPVHQERQELLKKKTRKILHGIFTSEEIDSMNIDWSGDWKINIIDHHNFLNHPLLATANIISNLWQIPSENPRGMIVLSDSGVPMNNFFHKRGVQFHGKQLNMVPSRERHLLYYAAPVHTSLPIAEAAQTQNMSHEEVTFVRSIEDIMENAGKHPLVKSFRDQVTRVNRELWKLMYHEDIRANIPELIYVTNEDTCNAMLGDLLQDPNNIFSKILFNKETRNIFITEFPGIAGCWGGERDLGTHFFWGLNESGENFSLEIEGETLVSRDRSIGFSLPLEKNAILNALAEKKVYPSMFMVYGVSVFYCGVLPYCGFGSMNYLSRMKDAWIRAMQQVDPSEVPLLESTNTRAFVGGPTATFRYDQKSGQYVSLFALDVIERGGMTREYLEQIGKIPLNAILKPALLNIYDAYLRPEEKQPLSITANDLMGDSFKWLQRM